MSEFDDDFTHHMYDDVVLEFEGVDLVRAYHSPEFNMERDLPINEDDDENGYGYTDPHGKQVSITYEYEKARGRRPEKVNIYVDDAFIKQMDVHNTPNGVYYTDPSLPEE